VAEPERAASVEHIAMVAAGARSCLAVAADGRLWSWGSQWQCPDDNDAPLGFVSVQEQNTPRVLALSAFGGSAVLLVAAGLVHGAAVTAAGELWTWGSGASGCTGLGALPPAQAAFRAPRRVGALGAGARVLMAACGSKHMDVLTNSGVVWTCGNGEHGVLGHGTLDSCDVPTRIQQEYFGGHLVASVESGAIPR